MRITLKPREIAILLALAAGPRTLHSFTHAAHGLADIQIAPHVIETYLSHMASLGLIAPPPRFDGKYAITEEGEQFLAQRPQVVCGTLICGASMKDPYVPPKWNIRAGGEQHRQFASLGTGA